MAASEAGHAPNRCYTDRDGAFHRNGSAFYHYENATGSVAVAGGTLAIPVTHRVVLKTTGGAEALTLANGVPGQLITIVLAADGGDGTLTPATCTGFATIVFADVKDNATLEYVDDTVGWVIVGAAGVLAPPVIS